MDRRNLLAAVFGLPLLGAFTARANEPDEALPVMREIAGYLRIIAANAERQNRDACSHSVTTCHSDGTVERWQNDVDAAIAERCPETCAVHERALKG
jgi:hypothetical protein